ncbi:MAG: phage integrase N-terminal SAM-like domain-containing protein [Verrucomicrobia bacterium]|nr:phage integrase N-terminal SAM-like domain-containing protein [Verrucomicrobiota bacterium]
MRFFHYSQRTEEAYWQWIVRYLRFHKRPGIAGPEAWRHPREMGAAEVTAFLTHLATAGRVSASTQNQALNALVFLYAEVLHQPLGELGDFARARRPLRVPARWRAMNMISRVKGAASHPRWPPRSGSRGLARCVPERLIYDQQRGPARRAAGLGAADGKWRSLPWATRAGRFTPSQSARCNGRDR